MNTSLYIARRYLFSKKSTNAINVLAGISMLGVLVGSAALFIIVSAFNGLEDMVTALYNRLTPDLSITSRVGKNFDPNIASFIKLKANQSIAFYVESLVDKALLRSGKNQYIATVKGVSESFSATHLLDSNLVSGSGSLSNTHITPAVVGAGVAYYLGLSDADASSPITLYAPGKSLSAASGAPELIQLPVYQTGIFQTQPDFDNEHIFVPIGFARKLFSEPVQVSAIALYLKPEVGVAACQKVISALVGDRFWVHNKAQQNPLVYKILRTEKWAIYLVLCFVLVIAISNIIGSLTMLVIDKKQDIAILSSMGASKMLIHRIFLFEGLLISVCGSVIGLLVGWVVVLLQWYFGWIKMAGTGAFVAEVYPVAIRWTDALLIFGTVLLFALPASLLAARLSVRNLKQLKKALS